MTLPSLTRMVAVASVFVSSLFAEEAPKKIGIIGLDTGHVVAFTTVFNKGPKNPADAAKFSGFRVTHAFAQGSKDIPESTKRVPEYTASLKGMGVEIVDSIEKLCAQVDFVMLESNDGQILRAAALDGLGILVQPTYIVYDDIVAGRLVPVLDDWDLPRLTINLAYPSRKHLSAKVRTFIDFMVEHFAKMDYERKWTARFGL